MCEVADTLGDVVKTLSIKYQVIRDGAMFIHDMNERRYVNVKNKNQTKSIRS